MAIAEVHMRLGKLLGSIDEVLGTPKVDIRSIERLIDQARWAKLYIDFELAFKPYRDVLDADWGTRKFVSETSARQMFEEFRTRLGDVAAETAGHVPLRNLRARVEGVLNVAQQWWGTLAHPS
ncbi:hypothetical protein DB31_4957 [Hyalangium minutum]|uniref:Uncharacterized protein n=2 Tax=Hyalangium minutum TaxID=394096 RepID=A0A085WQF2_9BACT|nr:hypothetical protein DB31_4957 [Hyalangium minutum]